MGKIIGSLCLTSLLALGLAAAPAHAQQARSFLSQTFGNDANAPNCTRTTPCRTLQVGHDNTLAAGEVTILDPGSYGALTITKSIGIINDGVGEAGTLVSGGANGVTVNAAGAAVTLRGLTIKGIGFGGGNGIVVNAVGKLNVESCTIRNLDGSLVGNGLLFAPNSAATLQITNSIVSDNTGNGIFVAPFGTGNTVAVLDHVGLYNNVLGAVLVFGGNASMGTVTVTLIESVAAGTASQTALLAQSDSGKAAATLNLIRSVATGNFVGVAASGFNSFVVAYESAVLGNANGWIAAAGGTIFTFGNNGVAGNFANQDAQTQFALK